MENESSTNNYVKLEEEYAEKPIPKSMRKSWFHLASLYMGMCAVIACCMGGWRFDFWS